jgi:hypothetical protein
LERKVSDPYQQQQQFNTGLPAATPYSSASSYSAQPAYGVPAPSSAQSAYGVPGPAPPSSTFSGYQPANPTPEPPPLVPFTPAAPATFPPAAAPSIQSPSGVGGNPLLKRGRAVDPSIAAPQGGYGGGGGGYGYAAAAPYNSGGFVQPEQQQQQHLYNPVAPANIFTPEPLAGSIGTLPGHGKIRVWLFFQNFPCYFKEICKIEILLYRGSMRFCH